jgi:type IV secretory pathway VirB3-like protein
MYYGFRKSFGYETRVILRFWMPKIILSVLMIVSVWMGITWLTLVLMALYFIHLIIDQKDDIAKTYSFVMNRLVKKQETIH